MFCYCHPLKEGRIIPSGREIKYQEIKFVSSGWVLDGHQFWMAAWNVCLFSCTWKTRLLTSFRRNMPPLDDPGWGLRYVFLVEEILDSHKKGDIGQCLSWVLLLFKTLNVISLQKKDSLWLPWSVALVQDWFTHYWAPMAVSCNGCSVEPNFSLCVWEMKQKKGKRSGFHSLFEDTLLVI